MPEEGGEAGRWYRLLGEVGRLQQPFEEREHGTDSRRVARRRHRGARWASFVDRMRAGRELRVGTMTSRVILGSYAATHEGVIALAHTRCGNHPVFAGAGGRTRPEPLSVASHSAPSGPWRTSRMRSRSCCNRRSSLTTLSLSTSSRTKVWPASAPTKRLPRHAANKSPVKNVMPDGAIDGTQYRSGCSLPGLSVLSWILAPL